MNGFTNWLLTGVSSFLVPLLLGSCLTTAPGCAFIKPTTEVQVDPFSKVVTFRDTKDNDILLEGLSVDPDTKVLSLAKLSIANKSTPVIEANVAQMQMFTEQQRAANEGIATTLAGLSQIIGQIMPMMTQTRDIVDDLARLVAEMRATNTTVQPSGP